MNQKETKVGLKDISGVGNESLNERYLGLPTMVGRSKNGAFQHILERAWGKVLGCKKPRTLKSRERNSCEFGIAGRSIIYYEMFYLHRISVQTTLFCYIKILVGLK